MKKPNILLITVDCLRADHMSCYGYGRKTTPSIDKLCDDGSVLFSNHMSNGATTPDSFPSIMCSRYRLEIPGLKLPTKWPTIAEILKDSGYNTFGMSSMNPWTSEFFGYDRGFDVFNSYMKDIDPDGVFELDGWGRTERLIRNFYDIFIGNVIEHKRTQDMTFARDVSLILKRLNGVQPWFLWVHYMDVHTDYFPERLYYGNGRLKNTWYAGILNKMVKMDKHFGINIRRDIIDLYDSTIRQVDENIGKILNEISDDVMVVVTADHGEAFEEHDHWAHQYYSMYEELLRIPLIIRYPYQRDTHIIREPTSSVDIMPTIADVTGSFLPFVVRGISLRHHIPSDRVVFHEGTHIKSLREQELETIPSARGATLNGKRLVVGRGSIKTRFHDLESDCKETTNLIYDDDYEDTIQNLLNMIGNMKKNEKRTMNLEGVS